MNAAWRDSTGRDGEVGQIRAPGRVMSRLAKFFFLFLIAGMCSPGTAQAAARTYFMYLNTGTVLTQPAVTTNTICPVAADTALGAVPGIGLMADIKDATCVPAVNRDVRWTAATTLSLYYNGAGYASAMNVVGTSVGIRARGVVAGSILTANLFYTTSTGVKVYFTGTPGSVAVTAARADYTLSLAGLSATNIPAGSKLGVEFSWVNATGMRLTVNQSVLSDQLIVDETVAAPPTPTVVSINCVGACTSNAASVSWDVTFNTSVTGVSSGNFTLVNSGLGGAPAITGVSGSGTIWTVTASTGTGTGTLGLDMSNTTGVTPALTNLPFTGQVYTLDRTAPVVSSIVRVDLSPTALASVSWTVTFSETVTGVDATDFALAQAGSVSGALITGVTPVSGTVYTVTASTGTGNGTLGLNLADNDSIIDAVSNPLGGTGAGNGDFSGETYSMVRPVTVTASPTACLNVAGIGTIAWNPATLAGPLASDNAYATASVNDNQTTNYLQCTGYGFAIPAGATINGITVNVERKASNTLVRDAAMRLVKDVAGVATIQATDRSTLTNYTTVDVIEAHGGAADLWGGAWTAADINSGNFGAALASRKNGTTGGARTVSVDHISISIDYTVPTPLAEYRMDEASWNGTANEAVDSGAGGFNGTAAGLVTKPTTANTGPAIAGSPGTCRYGVFNRSNKDYLALPAGFPNLAATAGDFTITAWINVADNTLPGQRILIDDQGNTSPGGWGFSVGETTAFGAGGLRFYYRQPSVYILDTAPIPSNQWLFVALSVQLAAGANASTATIYAYNTAGTLVTSNTGTFTWTAGSDPGPSSIGGETNASGEGTNAFGFGGNLDEVRVYQKALSQAALVAIAAQTHVCPINVPDHLEIQSSGSGLTCAASTLTIKACTDAAVPCVTPYTLGVSGTLSASGTPTVNWDGTTGGAAGADFVIPNGSSSVTKDVQVVTAGSVVFGVSSATPTPANATACNFGTPSCTFTANTAGFIFSDTSSPGDVYTIPAQVSGTATPTRYLRAVQASTTNPAVCTPAIISQTVGVNMGYTCNNPASCQAGNLTTINATAVAPGGTAVSLTFDGNGSAPITARYDDAGQITLNANKTVTPFGGATAVALNGSSNTFVVAPASFSVTGVTAGPIKAGNPFSATVTALNALGNATPNFGKETAPEGATLSSVLAMGAGTWANPALGGDAVIPGASFTNGAATVTTLTWGEVGEINLQADLTGASYLGSGLTATGSTTASTLFIPDHYITEIISASGVPFACPGGLTVCPSNPTEASGMVYSGQPFSVKVTAQNLADSTTSNYQGAYAQDVTLSGVGAAGSLSNPLLLASNFAGGAGTTTSLPAYTFTAAGPTDPADVALHAAGTGASSAIASSGAGEGALKVVSGRANGWQRLWLGKAGFIHGRTGAVLRRGRAGSDGLDDQSHRQRNESDAQFIQLPVQNRMPVDNGGHASGRFGQCGAVVIYIECADRWWNGQCGCGDQWPELSVDGW